MWQKHLNVSHTAVDMTLTLSKLIGVQNKSTVQTIWIQTTLKSTCRVLGRCGSIALLREICIKSWRRIPVQWFKIEKASFYISQRVDAAEPCKGLLLISVLKWKNRKEKSNCASKSRGLFIVEYHKPFPALLTLLVALGEYKNIQSGGNPDAVCSTKCTTGSAEPCGHIL